MKRIPKLKILLGSLLLVGALLALAVVPVMAQIPVFSPFSGSVTIDDAAATVGSEVRAYVDGEPADLLAPAVDDVYTLTTAGEYEIVIQTDATGKAVTFEVKKAGTIEWLAATSDPAAPVTSYAPQDVDLAAYTGVVYYTLTVTVSPAGSGTTDPAVGTHSYAAGTVVPITATAAAGYDFDHWGGDASGTSTTTTVTMDSNKSVTAYFTAEGVPEYPSFTDWLYWWIG